MEDVLTFRGRGLSAEPGSYMHLALAYPLTQCPFFFFFWGGGEGGQGWRQHRVYFAKLVLTKNDDTPYAWEENVNMHNVPWTFASGGPQHPYNRDPSALDG